MTVYIRGWPTWNISLLPMLKWHWLTKFCQECFLRNISFLLCKGFLYQVLIFFLLISFIMQTLRWLKTSVTNTKDTSFWKNEMEKGTENWLRWCYALGTFSQIFKNCVIFLQCYRSSCHIITHLCVLWNWCGKYLHFDIKIGVYLPWCSSSQSINYHI